MQIEVKGRNLQVTDEMREYVARRFDKIGKQVSELAVLELEVADENVPGDPVAAEAVLHLKGTQLRAKEVSKDAKHAINLVGDNMERQVKRHREKRRGRRESRAAAEVSREHLPEPRGEPRQRLTTPVRRVRTARLESYVHPRARPANGRSEAVPGLLQARRADQRLGGRARAARG